jgi:hypothetical protein
MTTEPEFTPFPKIARLNRDITITEKIDGTNAAIVIQQTDDEVSIYAQSRKRVITPDDDNFGFAAWVFENFDALVSILGPGIHFGEWWGSGIQRGYGLSKGEKRFSLFNTTRWLPELLYNEEAFAIGLRTVPVIYEGIFDTYAIDSALDDLREEGSYAAPGFKNPEGVVIFHHAGNHLYKVTLENDEVPKALVGKN